MLGLRVYKNQIFYLYCHENGLNVTKYTLYYILKNAIHCVYIYKLYFQILPITVQKCFCTRELLCYPVIRDEKLEKGRKDFTFLFNTFPSIMLSLLFLLFNLLLLSAPYNYVAHVTGLCNIWSPKQVTGSL